MARFQDKVVVITGASSGIGRSTARHFAEQGATVVLAARRRRALHEVARECDLAGGRSLVVPTDVCRREEVEDLAHAAATTFGRIDVWVNNAAVSMFGRFEETPAEAWEQVIRTNLFGYANGARAVLPWFREQGSGVLINVASIVGCIAQPYTSAYSASKFAIRGLSESLRQELLDVPGIQVCTVLPATVDTPLFQHAANYTGRAAVAMPPVYPPQAVAETILQLAQRPRREVFVGNMGRMLAAQHMLAPATTERMFARMVDRQHLSDQPDPPSDGNLFEPMQQWTGETGGWNGQSSGGGGMALAALALGVALPIGLYALSQQNQHLAQLARRS